MGKHWSYDSAPGSAAGTMRCTACGTQITEGRYRYRQKWSKGDWGYVSQHEACSTDDPFWAAMDRAKEADDVKRKERSRACREFRDAWGLDDELDYYIFDDDKDQP